MRYRSTLLDVSIQTPKQYCKDMKNTRHLDVTTTIPLYRARTISTDAFKHLDFNVTVLQPLKWVFVLSHCCDIIRTDGHVKYFSVYINLASLQRRLQTSSAVHGVVLATDHVECVGKYTAVCRCRTTDITLQVMFAPRPRLRSQKWSLDESRHVRETTASLTRRTRV